MSDFFEVDPITGIRTDFKWSENDQEYTLLQSQDVEPALKFAADCRNEAGLNREGIAANWWIYATIPPIVQLQMRAKGIDICNRDHQERLLAEINSNYPHLKLTTGNEGGRTKLFG